MDPMGVDEVEAAKVNDDLCGIKSVGLSKRVLEDLSVTEIELSVDLERRNACCSHDPNRDYGLIGRWGCPFSHRRGGPPRLCLRLHQRGLWASAS